MSELGLHVNLEGHVMWAGEVFQISGLSVGSRSWNIS